MVLEEYGRKALSLDVFITGGDAAALATVIPGGGGCGPEMTLEGIYGWRRR